MSGQMICNRGTLCEYPDCPAGQPHDPQLCRDCHGPECDARKPGRCVPVEPPAQMICPRAGECHLDMCEFGHDTPHECNPGCVRLVMDATCPACLGASDIVGPVPGGRTIDLGDIGEFVEPFTNEANETAVSEPTAPVDLVVQAREWAESLSILDDSSVFIYRLIGEVERLRNEAATATAFSRQAVAENGRLRDDVATLAEERDELRRERGDMYRRYTEAEKSYDNACRDYAELSVENAALRVEHDELKIELARQRTGYDWHIRKLIAEVQALVNHYRHPDTFRAPNADELEAADEVWKAANDFNVARFRATDDEVTG